MAPRFTSLGPSPELLFACAEMARWLYGPQEVWPYLRLELRPAPEQPPQPRLEELLRWLRGRTELDPTLALCPDGWRAPGEVLWQGRGSGAELALLLWSAAPLVGLSQGCLVLGRCGAPEDEPLRLWVEWPALALLADPVRGRCLVPGGGYRPLLMVWPPNGQERCAA